jgi:translation elongation factor EF-1alpha
MSEQHDPEQAIGRVTHYFSHLRVAVVSLEEPLAVGDRIHIRGHTSNVEQTVASMEVDHAHVDRAKPGDDVALKVDDHVRDHDLIFREEAEATSTEGEGEGEGEGATS